MKRPVGLILSAIVLSLVALFLLLTVALMTLAGIFAGHQLSTPAVPHFALYLMIAFSVLYAVLATWAILTVIGIVRLRSWARYSILIIGGGLAVFNILAIAGTVAGALLTRTMLPTLQAQQPPVDPHIMSVVFLVMTAIYLLVAGVGIWWLIYFNLRSTRELFSNQAMLHSPTGSTSTSSSTGRLSQTPTAIKIIGGFFLFSAVTCLLCVFLPSLSSCWALFCRRSRAMSSICASPSSQPGSATASCSSKSPRAASPSASSSSVAAMSFWPPCRRIRLSSVSI